EKKVKRAVTDPEDPPRIVRAPEKPGVSNLIDVLAVARGQKPEDIEREMASARGYGDLKTATAAAVIDMLAPVRERYGPLREDEEWWLARMLEARRYRAAADHLARRLEDEHGIRYRSGPLPRWLRRTTVEEAGEAVYDPAKLGKAIGGLLRHPPELSLRHLTIPRVSVGERLAHLRHRLRRR